MGATGRAYEIAAQMGNPRHRHPRQAGSLYFSPTHGFAPISGTANALRV